jgi:hypothetical protein
MKVCSVELRSNEAIICLLTLEGGMIGIPECRTQKFVMDNSLDNQKMRDFQFAFKKLLDDYKVEKVVIRNVNSKKLHLQLVMHFLVANNISDN